MRREKLRDLDHFEMRVENGVDSLQKGIYTTSRIGTTPDEPPAYRPRALRVQ